ncbi:MAG: nucleoside recognition domain-containing protein [Elusimicrobiota bacterium]|jgi:spore maturation protein SpmA
MTLNYIWLGFFFTALIVALARFAGYVMHFHMDMLPGLVFTVADRDIFVKIVESTFEMSKTSVTIAITLIGVMTLWLGIMRVGERGGAVAVMTRLVRPFFRRIFPDLPDGHPAFGSMMMNISANMLGLDNAATPLGIKAMEQLQEANPDKTTASNPQIMFIALNTSGLTLIPVSIMAVRAAMGAANPADIFLPILLTTFFSTMAALVFVSAAQRINLFQPVIVAYVGGLSLAIGVLLWGLSNMAAGRITALSTFGGNFILFLFIVAFLFLAWRRSVNVYEEFVEGAKEGFHVAVRIIPYLVAMLVAVGVFRASGALDMLVSGVGKFLGLFGLGGDFVGALPTAFMKPLSGSGARGMMIEAFNHYGVDSFTGRLAATFQGSTETTFYTIAVYYGAVNVRNTRYTVMAGLFAELAAIIAGIFIAGIFFGS